MGNRRPTSGMMLVDDLGSELDLGGTSVTAVIAESAAISGAIDFRGRIGGVVHMGAAWTTAELGFKVSPTAAGTFLPLYDAEGVLVTIPVAAGKSFCLPIQKMPAVRYLKFWSQNGSGTDTVQTAARTLLVDLI